MSNIKFYKKITLALTSLLVVFSLGKHFLAANSIGSFDAAFAFLEFKSRAWSHGGGSSQAIDFHINSWNDIFAFFPWGAFTALFRPFPWELPSLIGIAAGLENILLLTFLSIVLLNARWREFKNPDFDEMKARMRELNIFDARNIYNPKSILKEGFKYYGIGRQVPN